MPRLPVKEGVRQRLTTFVFQNKQSRWLFKAFGVSNQTLLGILGGHRLPSLRQALVIDCITNGECSIYDWVETEQLISKSRELVDIETQKTAGDFKSNQQHALKDSHKHLRRHLVHRLSNPGLNALTIVTKLGVNETLKIVRRKRRKETLAIPVAVDIEATDEQVQRAIERRERQRTRANAYVAGHRAACES